MTKQKQNDTIRKIACTVNGDRFAVAESNDRVQVWDINKGLIHKFSTDFDAGNNRLSISDDGKYLIVGGYSKNTITAYNVDSGEQLWQRKDLKKCSSVVILSNFDNQVFISLERQGSQILDINSGSTIDKLRGVNYYYENPFSTIDLLDKTDTFSLLDRKSRKTVKTLTKTTFAILDSSFSKDYVFCAYSCNPLEAISINDFSKRWSAEVSGHFLELQYCNELDKLLGIRWDYEKGGSKYLSYLEPETGSVTKEIDLGEPIELKFLKQGNFLLTSQGKLISSKTGESIDEYNFETE